jgi:hypothetical protein
MATHRLITSTFIALLLVVGSGCVSTKNRQATAIDTLSRFRLAATEASATGQLVGQQPGRYFVAVAPAEMLGLAHPATVSATELETRLAWVGLHKGLTITGLLPADELKALTKDIARGLERAGPDEEVIFAVTDTGGSLLPTEAEITTGRLFVDDGQLQLVVGFAQAAPADYARSEGHPLLPRFGSRAERTTVGWSLESYREEQVKVGRRGDWLLFPSRGLVLSSSSVLPHARRPNPAVAGSEEITQDQPRKALPGMVPLNMAPSAGASQSAVPASRDEGLQALRERLEFLHRLHADGLVDEEGYQRKRAALLDEI